MTGKKKSELDNHDFLSQKGLQLAGMSMCALGPARGHSQITLCHAGGWVVTGWVLGHIEGITRGGPGR